MKPEAQWVHCEGCLREGWEKGCLAKQLDIKNVPVRSQTTTH